MQSKTTTIDEYIQLLSEDRKEAVQKLRQVVLKNIPDGFTEAMGYGMIASVVPHSIYPAGYHCQPNRPLPFANIASQKNFISFYHMGIYSNPKLLNWFVNEYPKHCKSKLDMGKSCIRLKKIDEIPYDLIGELMSKITVKDWIILYENAFKKQ